MLEHRGASNHDESEVFVMAGTQCALQVWECQDDERPLEQMIRDHLDMMKARGSNLAGYIRYYSRIRAHLSIDEIIELHEADLDELEALQAELNVEPGYGTLEFEDDEFLDLEDDGVDVEVF